MSQTKTRRTAQPPRRRRGAFLSRWIPERVLSEGLALALLALTALLAVSLLSFHASDPAPLFGTTGALSRPRNLAGPVGAFLAAATLQCLGKAALLLPVLSLLMAWDHLTTRGARLVRPRLAGLLLLMVAFTGLLGLWSGKQPVHSFSLPAGGFLGASVAGFLESLLSSVGALIVLLALLLLGLLLTTRLSLQATLAGAQRGSLHLTQRGRLLLARLKTLRERRRVRRQAVRRQLAAAARRPPQPPTVHKKTPPVRVAISEDHSKGSLSATPAPPAPEPPADLPLESAAQLPLADLSSRYQLPPLSLLKEAGARTPVDEEELLGRARLLSAKLLEFGIGGEVLGIHPGPVITTFEFKPEAGVKYSRITNLIDDVSLALKAESVRIERLPGRATIGIEVPNLSRETIRIRELLEADVYSKTRARLPLVLGKNIDGQPYCSALERMPHLLIAGATGSGKSVALNSMIASILFRATPDEVKFIFIDPKMLELGIYEDIPHLICPVVTDASRAARVLRWATTEMTRRYQLLFGHGVRNLEQFNRLVTTQIIRAEPTAGESDTEGQRLEPLPYIVVVIDELADLMMVSSKEVEAAIQRLAQMARAVGIHLIVATQRPSVDVLTGVIKANFPSRIAFRVSSRTDSNVILDQKGAERLLGTGDMLFLPPGSSSLLRIHGALMEEAEALRLISHLKQQGRPVFNPDILKADEEDSSGPGGLPALPRDPLFDKAARLVVASSQASVSLLQRRLGLGYARAARLMDALEADGLVGPPEGSKPRQVLVPADYFQQVDERPRG